jgi:hypothetical protein
MTLTPTKTKRPKAKGKPTAMTLTLPPAESATVEPVQETVADEMSEISATYAEVLGAIAKMEGQEDRNPSPLEPVEGLPTKPTFVSSVAVWGEKAFYPASKNGAWRRATPGDYTALRLGDLVGEDDQPWAYEFVSIVGGDAIARFPDHHVFRYRIPLERLHVKAGFNPQLAEDDPLIAVEAPLEPVEAPSKLKVGDRDRVEVLLRSLGFKPSSGEADEFPYHSKKDGVVNYGGWRIRVEPTKLGGGCFFYRDIVHVDLGWWCEGSNRFTTKEEAIIDAQKIVDRINGNPPLEPGEPAENPEVEVLGIDVPVSKVEPLPELDPTIERGDEVLGVARELQVGDRIHGTSLLNREYSGVFEGYAESGLITLRHGEGKRGTKLVRPDSVVVIGDRFDIKGQHGTTTKTGIVTALENNKITLKWDNGQQSEYTAVELARYGFARQVLGVETSEVLEQSTPRTLDEIGQDADDAIAQIEQQIHAIESSGWIAPDGCYLERNKCHGKKVYQVVLRSEQKIFAGKKSKYIGMAGSSQAKDAEAAIGRRNELKRLRRQMELLREVE